MEHSLITIREAEELIRVIDLCGVVPLVRLSANDPVQIKRVMDGGATGLAIKMVLLNFFGVNVQVYFNAKLLNLNYWRYIDHQFASVGCLLAIAAVASLRADNILGLRERTFASFFVAGIFYTIVLMSLACFIPVIFGINKEDIHFIQSKINSLFEIGLN